MPILHPRELPSQLCRLSVSQVILDAKQPPGLGQSVDSTTLCKGVERRLGEYAANAEPSETPRAGGGPLTGKGWTRVPGLHPTLQ